MKKTEIQENGKAIDLIIACESALENEQKAQKWRNEVKEMLKEKELQISEEILQKLVNAGSHRSNLSVSTSIILRKAVVYVHNWSYDVEYRDGDLTVNKDNERKCDVKLSEMTRVFDIITEVITKEGLQ